jgi:CheY-like chemotaxis protein
MSKNTSRILWVDDDRFMMKAFANLLNSLGYSNFVLLTGDTAGQDAVNMLRSEQFDVVITDRRIPNVDGFAVAEAVRHADEELGRPHTPVLMVTVGDVIKQISKDKKGPNFEWVHNSKNIWEVGIIKREEELSVTTLAKLVTKTKLQSALKTCASPSGRRSSITADDPVVDPSCIKAFLKPFFEQLMQQNIAPGINTDMVKRTTQLEMTAEKRVLLNFWSWYDEPHRAAQRVRNIRFTRCAADDREREREKDRVKELKREREKERETERERERERKRERHREREEG